MIKKFGYAIINKDHITLISKKDYPIQYTPLTQTLIESPEIEIPEENPERFRITGELVIEDFNSHISPINNLEDYQETSIKTVRCWWKPWKKIKKLRRGWIIRKKREIFDRAYVGYKIEII